MKPLSIALLTIYCASSINRAIGFNPTEGVPKVILTFFFLAVGILFISKCKEPS